MTNPKEPELRVVDRRWWARGDVDDAAEPAEARDRKPTVVEDLEERLQESQERLQVVLNEHRRVTDEFEQVKIRLRRDLTKEVERGRRAVLAEMLEVVDNLDRAIVAVRATNQTDGSETLLRGVELVREQFLAKLESFGVVRIQALGATFDPLRHEAVSMAPVRDPQQNGVVIAVAKEGYAIGDDLLRPASVVVGTHG